MALAVAPAQPLQAQHECRGEEDQQGGDCGNRRRDVFADAGEHLAWQRDLRGPSDEQRHHHFVKRGGKGKQRARNDARTRLWLKPCSVASTKGAPSAACALRSDDGFGKILTIFSKKVAAMKITSKGQVTIPQAVREQAGLLPYSEVEFEVRANGDVVIRAVATPQDSVRQRFARVRGTANASQFKDMGTDDFMAFLRG